MLSGIGDSAELQALGIAPAVDIPDVGKSLQVSLFSLLPLSQLSKSPLKHIHKAVFFLF